MRSPLPKTRRWKLTRALQSKLIGRFLTQARPRFSVWRSHSRWVLWKFYEDR